MGSLDVSVITCTSDRADAFALCQGYVRRQSFTDRIDWIVVDDGAEPVAVDNHAAWRVRHIRLPGGKSPKESFRANMLAAVELIETDKILIIEDDDWYDWNYVAMMAGLLDKRPLVGAAHARYYNVAHRRWLTHPNAKHASLCTTGFRHELLPTVQTILRESNFSRPENPQQLDGTLWKRSGIRAEQKLLLPASPHVVGIKGLPGKRGLGIHHRAGDLRGYHADLDLSKLREWIGVDAELYDHFFDSS